MTELLRAWDLDAVIVLPLLAAAGLYGIGTVRLRRRLGPGRGIRASAAALFAAGWLLLVLVLVSPLHALSEQLFAAHMVEHETLMIAAAPLLVLSQPLPAFMWSLPRGARILIAASISRMAPMWRFLTAPLIATVLHGVAIWIWHVPPLFLAALGSQSLHWLQHASFLGTGLLFWWAMLRPRQRRGGYGRSVGHLFATSMHTGLLGALLTLSPRPWFPTAGGLGFTPLEDQQLGGLLMWFPGCMVYAIAALVLAGRWIMASSRPPALAQPSFASAAQLSGSSSEAAQSSRGRPVSETSILSHGTR